MPSERQFARFSLFLDTTHNRNSPDSLCSFGFALNIQQIGLPPPLFINYIVVWRMKLQSKSRVQVVGNIRYIQIYDYQVFQHLTVSGKAYCRTFRIIDPRKNDVDSSKGSQRERESQFQSMVILRFNQHMGVDLGTSGK